MQVATPNKWERKPVLLWVGKIPSIADGSLAVGSILETLGFLRKSGFECKFLAADFKRIEPVSSQLNDLGIDTLDGEWFSKNWQNWAKDHALGIDFVFFDEPDVCATFLPLIQTSTQASVIYQCPRIQVGSAFTKSEEYAQSNCDVLLAFNQTDAEIIKISLPLKPVFCAPSFVVSQEQSVEKQLEQTADVDINAILSVAKEEALLRIAGSNEAASPQKPARLIAFYLPQYHPIAENNEWWGEGFTEWRNVRKTKPLFSGHYQPHVPADLGYYDLRQEETRIAQAELAKQYGVEGFCYYHYWFQGKRLLEGPLEELVKSGKPDFPFCICWANESWSRRWDGKDQEILMRQEYSEKDDLEHIRALIPLFEDPRYIRINGKPLFLVYRAENIPDPVRTAEIWRNEARKAGLGELYLCRVESFVKGDPAEFGFDASIEFAPDWWDKGPQLSVDSELFDQAEDNLKQVCDNNYIHSYEGLSEAMMAKEMPNYKWMRCVTPSWDNWARRHEGASVFLGSTPEKYQTWLSSSVDNTNLRLYGEERIVFINAWNEWAEGNHLEPDEKFGHAYLEATRDALKDGQLATEVRRLGAADQVRMNRLTTRLANSEYQLNELQVQIGDMLESTSWRATSFMRWIKQKILDLKKLKSG
jgi:hypothetical protein